MRLSPDASSRARRRRRPRLLSGPVAAGLTAAAVLVAAAVAIIALQHASDDRRVQQLLLADLEASSAEQRQLELRAVAAGRVDGQLEATIDRLFRRLDLTAAATARASADDASLGQVADRVAAFRLATSRALAELAAGRRSGAARVDREDVDPSYLALAWLVDEAQANAGRRAEDAAALARAGTLGVMALAAVLLIVIMLQFDRARRAAHEALYDPLTGLPNRSLFGDRLTHAVELADRRGETLAVLFVDLDDFKTVNDSLGHAAGDELLLCAAERAVVAARSSDSLARLGGDEFAFLLERTTEEGAALFAERFIEVLRAPLVIAGRNVTVDATIGCALSTPGKTGADELLRNADLAMYAGKRKGKGCFVTYEPSMYEALADRLELEADLRGALERNEITVSYQPIVDVATGRLTAVEALARWNHPERGGVTPSVFIPLAEETGVIRALGRHVLVTACTQAKRWQDERPDQPIGITVNVSPAQFQHGELAADVRGALEHSGLAAALLTLEITESVLVERGDTFVDELEELSAIGVRLAVDDFGTGYSSLSSLARFPVDVLKIDRSFVVDVAHDDDGQALVRSIVELGRSLGLVAVAEGVEASNQVSALIDAGCGLGQGFHFARPMDAEAINDLLAGRTAPAEEQLEAPRAAPASTRASGTSIDSLGPPASAIEALPESGVVAEKHRRRLQILGVGAFPGDVLVHTSNLLGAQVQDLGHVVSVETLVQREDADVELIEAEREEELLLILRHREGIGRRCPFENRRGYAEVPRKLENLRLEQVCNRLDVGGSVTVLHEEALVVFELVGRPDDCIPESIGMEVLEHLPRALLEVGRGDNLPVDLCCDAHPVLSPVRRFDDENRDTKTALVEQARQHDLRQPAVAERWDEPANRSVSALVRSGRFQDPCDALHDRLDAERVPDHVCELDGVRRRLSLGHDEPEHPFGAEGTRAESHRQRAVDPSREADDGSVTAKATDHGLAQRLLDSRELGRRVDAKGFVAECSLAHGARRSGLGASSLDERDDAGYRAEVLRHQLFLWTAIPYLSSMKSTSSSTPIESITPASRSESSSARRLRSRASGTISCRKPRISPATPDGAAGRTSVSRMSGSPARTLVSSPNGHD